MYRSKIMPVYFYGQPSDRGEIQSEPFSKHEGYATITCGNTTFKIGYSALAAFLRGEKHSTAYQSVSSGLNSICAEASIGGIPSSD